MGVQSVDLFPAGDDLFKPKVIGVEARQLRYVIAENIQIAEFTTVFFQAGA
jgi:hypothetical protein